MYMFLGAEGIVLWLYFMCVFFNAIGLLLQRVCVLS